MTNSRAAEPGTQVLLVDDDAAARDALRRLLEAAGYRVAAAGDGRAALGWLRASGRPAVILLDLDMPVMNGWQFRREQLGDPSLAPIPVILLSAEPFLGDTAADLGAAGFAPKPAEAEEIVHAIEGLVQRGRPPPRSGK